jgi:hypothetical protein
VGENPNEEKGANPDSNEVPKSTEKKHHRKIVTSGLLHEKEKSR